jgi:zeaxanthin glucosyltransferase
MHIAFISPPFLSHTRALQALATVLLDRGHRVSWIHLAEVGEWLSDSRIEFHAIGLQSHPPGSLEAIVQRACSPGGPLGLRRVIADVAAGTALYCREAPELLSRLGVDAIVADQMEAAGGLLADGLGIPFVSVACALPVNRDPCVPLPVMPWAYARDERSRKVNEASTRVYDWLMQPHAKVIARYAAHFGLERRTGLHHCLSTLAQISQTTAGFDFPREPATPLLHHVGPLRATACDTAALDLPLEDTRPFVFASLGTLQGHRLALFKRMALACRAEGAQLLIAHCNRLDASHEDALRQCGATAVTGFAPQHAALARADAVITHGGLNTVMDALTTGTPQLALPIAFDQPGVAARASCRPARA